MGYCVRGDLYKYGLPRGALRNPGRPADSASAADDTFTIDVHGFELNDVVSFRAESAGRLPQPIIAGVNYYVIPVTESKFQVAAVADGPAIDLITDGSRIVAIVPLDIDSAIEWAAGIIDDNLPAEAVPLKAPYPPIIVMTNAELAIGKLLNGSSSKSLSDMVDVAGKRVARWEKGVALRGTNTQNQTSTQVAVSGPVNPADRPCRPPRDDGGWNRFGGL